MARRQGYRPSRSRSGANAVPVTDPRFARISTDPRFRLPSKKHTHVAVDQRFARMLRDDDFSRKATVDRYGRRIPKGSGQEELKRFYNLERGEESERSEEKDEGEDSGDEEENAVERKLAKMAKPYDPARDGGFSSSEEDTSDEEKDDEEAVVDEEDQQYPDLQVDETTDVPMGEISSRIAVVNLDWDNIRAVDLMAVFSSFCPPDGRLQHVAIYPSEFGKERLAREEVEGPPREIFANRPGEEHDRSSSEDEDEEEADDEKIKKSLLQEDKGEEFDNTKLRRYQLERLRYYYAILTLSSAEAAKALYDATDGTEYLTTANFFDLRFVSDDVSFEGDRVRDECSSIPDDYKPNDFVTDALQHSKVKLTWDAEDNVRKEVVKKAFSGSRRDIEENDLKAYLGSDSSEDEAVEDVSGVPGQINSEAKTAKKEQERQRLRAALGLETVPASSGGKKADAPVGDMQITFTSGLSGPVKPSTDFPSEETTIEKYKRKEKERKQKHREKIAAARGGDDTSKSVSGGGQAADVSVAAEENQADDDLGFDDPFFTSAPDEDITSKPTKKTNTSRKAERERRRQEAEQNEAQTSRDRAELELLMLDDDIFPPYKVEPDNSATPDRDPQAGKFSHFDINEIARAEKKANEGRKKQKAVSLRHGNLREHELDEQGRKKKDRRKIGDNRQGQGQDGFKVNTHDPRFAALYHQPEYAIDPTNPRYRDTKVMRTLLEEGRKRRRGREGEDNDVDDGKDSVSVGRRDGENMDVNGTDDREGIEKRQKRKRARISADDGDATGATATVAAGGDESTSVHEGRKKKRKNENKNEKKKEKGEIENLRKLAEKVKRKSIAALTTTTATATAPPPSGFKKTAAVRT